MTEKIISYALAERMLDGGTWHVGHRMVRSRFSGPAHVHCGFHEIMLCFDGEIGGRLRNTDVRLKKGQAHFVGEKDLHEVKTRGGRWINLAFTPEWLRWADRTLDTGQLLRALPKQDPPVSFQVGHSRLEKFEKDAQAIQAKVQGGVQDLEFRLLFLDILACLVRQLGNRQSSVRPGKPAWFRTTLARFEALAPEERNRLKLIQLSARSEAHLCRCFRKFRNESLSAYINGLRTQEAARLLRETEQSVTDVGFLSGFNSLNQFHMEFRQRFGTTPLRYRNACFDQM